MSTWSFFSKVYGYKERNAMLQKLYKWQCNALIFLTSNTDPNAPVSIFQNEHGGALDFKFISTMVDVCRELYSLKGYLIPTLFCDDGDNHKLQFAPDCIQEHYIGSIIMLLRPYIAGVLIGLESSEYFDKDKHEYFIRIIKRFAPELLVGTHMQKDIQGGTPTGLDFIAFEASWNPDEGDNHSPEELLAEVENARARWKLPIIPVEYNTNVEGGKAKEQSRFLLKKGYSIGTPI